MVTNWNSLQGQMVDNAGPLGKCLYVTEHGSVFAAPYGERQELVAVKLQISDTGHTGVGLSHPNLLAVFEAGTCELDGVPVPVQYAVMELADDDLSIVLAERALTPEEATEVLEAVLGALEYLHSRALVHGRLKPSNVMSTGDRIKISSDHVQPAEPGRRPSEDVWSLGVLLVQILTQRVPVNSSGRVNRKILGELPHPLREIAAGCLVEDPGKRWTLAQIRAFLASPQEAPAAANPSRRRMYAALAAALVGLAAVAWVNTRPSATPVAAQPATAQRLEQAVSPPPPGDPAPAPIAAPRATQERWRVVVYTYANATAAQRRVRAIEERWPGFDPQVFVPFGKSTYQLVTLGGYMTREEAERLQRKALTAGLPQDTYIQNF